MRPKIVIAYDATAGRSRRPRPRRPCWPTSRRGSAGRARAARTPTRPRRPSARCSMVPRHAHTRRARRPPSCSATGRSRYGRVFGVSVADGHQRARRRPGRGADRLRLAPPRTARPRRCSATPPLACDGAPCAVAVAPRGFRRRTRLEPAGDRRRLRRLRRVRGRPRRRPRARARRGRVTLRVLTVEPAGLSRPLRQPRAGRAALDASRSALAGDVDVESWRYHGDPVHIARRARPSASAC